MKQNHAVIEIVVGPLTHEELADYLVKIAELVEEHLPDLPAAFGARVLDDEG